MAGSRCIPNNFPELLALGDTRSNMQRALEDIVANYPPLDHYDQRSPLKGLWSGPTGIAYLFLHVSAAHPQLVISGHRALTWAKSYIKGSRANLEPSSKCGIGDERLSYHAVAAAITRDRSHVRELLSSIPDILRGDYPDELLQGRAGTLYLLRMVRHWVPDGPSLVDDAIAQVARKTLRDGPHWRWHGKRYTGAVHGDIGVLTQLVLSAPAAVAPEVGPLLDALLDAQLADGNWPSSEGSRATTASLVQFCHGAAGFVHSLLSMREYFPGDLGRKIDAAVRRGRECIWTSGLLRKEPSLCHGIFGNALALPAGQQREHFLAVATPENMAKLKAQDETLFEPADYGQPYSLLTSYTPCAAWSWMVCGQEVPKIVAFNDV